MSFEGWRENTNIDAFQQLSQVQTKLEHNKKQLHKM